MAIDNAGVSSLMNYDPSGKRTRPVSLAVGLAVIALLGATVVGLVRAHSDVAAFFKPDQLRSAAGAAFQGWSDTVLDKWFWAFLALMLVLQWLFPARREQRGLSARVAADMVWFLMFNAMTVSVVAISLGAFDLAYTQLTGGWSLDLQSVFGGVGLAIFALVVTDLFTWCTHWCHHKVPTLWLFHAVHHSQQHLNALSDNREHIGETIVSAALVFVPARIFGLESDVASTLAFFGVYVQILSHANIRTGLGPLRYVLISPQAHRIHHSNLPQHFDKNYGSCFAMWDYVFRTRYHGNHEYPTTGIRDSDFPMEGSARPWSLAGVWVRQTIYPFRVIVKSMTRSAESEPQGLERQAVGTFVEGHAKLREHGDASPTL
jgi:sterol desaturase/sphingolipid hydroxylase (fatty acid hydroxylase superfamily)